MREKYIYSLRMHACSSCDNPIGHLILACKCLLTLYFFSSVFHRREKKVCPASRSRSLRVSVCPCKKVTWPSTGDRRSLAVAADGLWLVVPWTRMFKRTQALSSSVSCSRLGSRVLQQNRVGLVRVRVREARCSFDKGFTPLV